MLREPGAKPSHTEEMIYTKQVKQYLKRASETVIETRECPDKQ